MLALKTDVYLSDVDVIVMVPIFGSEHSRSRIRISPESKNRFHTHYPLYLEQETWDNWITICNPSMDHSYGMIIMGLLIHCRAHQIFCLGCHTIPYLYVTTLQVPTLILRHQFHKLELSRPTQAHQGIKPMKANTSSNLITQSNWRNLNSS